MNTICVACLSINRRLFLVENLNITWLGFQFSEEAKVCWECKRFLTRIWTFKEQVTKAQLLLSSYITTATVPSTLSKLDVSYKDTYDKVFLQDEDVFKLESTTIKHELSNDDDSEFDFGEGVVVPVEFPLGVAGPSRHEEERSAPGVESIEEGAKKEEEASSCYEVVYVDEEVMQRDRQKRLKSKRFMNAPYKCETCIIEFKIPKTYEKHQRNKHSEYNRFRYPCRVCSQRFERQAELNSHTRSHYLYRRCRECEFQHKTPAVVTAHYETRHETRQVYVCSLCTLHFLTRRQRKAHVQSAHGEAATCHLCSKTFCNPQSLKLHLNTHADLPRVECPVCGRRYKGEHTLSQHMKTHEPRPESAEAYCAECDIRFKSRVVLNSHLRYSIRHVSEDSFKHQCNECGRRFAMKYKLEDHVEREHIKIYKYACERCGKKFLSSLQKRSHLNKSHNVNAAVVDKRVTCNICGKEFSSASTCKKHQRVHTGERPYHCQYCPMQFSQGSTLRTHIRGKHKNLCVT